MDETPDTLTKPDFLRPELHHLSVEKKGPKEMGFLVWGGKSLDLDPDKHCLIVPKDSKRIASTFTKDELIKEILRKIEG